MRSCRNCQKEFCPPFGYSRRFGQRDWCSPTCFEQALARARAGAAARVEAFRKKQEAKSEQAKVPSR